MKIKLKYFTLFWAIIILTSGCGFKAINNTNEKFFSIRTLEFTGDKRLTYYVQNQLNMSSSKNSVNEIDLKIDISKDRQIKEKNISNKITKYQITIKINIELSDANNGEMINREFSSTESYNVETSFSDTNRNEKKLEDNLIKSISEKIVNYINLKYR